MKEGNQPENAKAAAARAAESSLTPEMVRVCSGFGGFGRGRRFVFDIMGLWLTFCCWPTLWGCVYLVLLFVWLCGCVVDCCCILDLQKENFEKVFHEFDSDNGGTIDTDELMDIMNSLNMPRT